MHQQALHPASCQVRREKPEEKDARIESMLRISQEFRSKAEQEHKRIADEKLARSTARLKISHRLIAWMLNRYTSFRVRHICDGEIRGIGVPSELASTQHGEEFTVLLHHIKWNSQ